MLQNRGTVFVVDDDAAVRRSLIRLLRSAGWDAEAFASAGDLLERAPFAGCGCVLLDVQMPGMNGLELQERMAAACFSRMMRETPGATSVCPDRRCGHFQCNHSKRNLYP